MYIGKEDRKQLLSIKNEALDSINTKLELILETLNLKEKECVLKEDATTDEITVEVDGETVVDTNDNDVADTVESEVNETAEENPAETIGPEKGLVDMLIGAIKDEYEAIQFYSDIITYANDEGGFEEAVRILKHINEEEQIHVGMLQQLLKKFDTSAEAVETGKEEATEIIADEELTETDTAIEA